MVTEYLAVAPPNFETLYQWNPELLDRAYRFWKISNSPMPPTPDEILYRDSSWDNAVMEYAYSVDFFEDQKKLKKKGMI